MFPRLFGYAAATRLAVALGEAYRDAEHDVPSSPFEGEGISVAVDVPRLMARLGRASSAIASLSANTNHPASAPGGIRHPLPTSAANVPSPSVSTTTPAIGRGTRTMSTQVRSEHRPASGATEHTPAGFRQSGSRAAAAGTRFLDLSFETGGRGW